MIADLSHFQGAINWSLASPHLDFVILRASVGLNKDNRYLNYAENCKIHNIPFGVYHYVKATDTIGAIEEANHFYNIASKMNPLFYVADIEYEPTIQAGYDEIGFTFLQQLKKLGATKLGLYIPQRYYPSCTLSQTLIDFNWIPRYGKNNGKFDPQYAPNCYYDLHQYTDKGTIEGIPTNVDLNRLSDNKTLSWFTQRKETNNMAYVMTAQQMIDKCLDIVHNYKTIYMYATYGFQVTDATIKNKSTQNLNGWYNRSDRVARLKAVANQTPPTWGFDCVNLIKGILWGWNGDVTKEKGGAKYGANGVPDTNADGFFNRCTQKSSDFSTIQPGEAVWLKGHIGVYIGNNLVVECTPSFSNEVLISGLKNVASSDKYPNRTWTKHGFIPWLDYSNGVKVETEPEKKEFELGERILGKGAEGNDVKELQGLLIELGFDLGSYGDDGDFGTKTKEAVENFQKKYGLKVTGVFDKTSYTKLMEVTQDNGGEDVEEPEPEEEAKQPSGVKGEYTVIAKSVYLWDGHPKQGGQKGVIVHRGDQLEEPELDGYVPIMYNGSLKWINKKYVKEN